MDLHSLPFTLLSPPPWATGLLCAVVGYTFCGLGLNLIRLSHIKSSPPALLHPTAFNRPSSHTTPLWACGYLLQLVGGALNLAALRFAAQSLVAPLSSVALLTNLAFATALLGERFAPSDIPSLLTIVLGNILAVTAASHAPQTTLTIAALLSLSARPAFRLWLLFASLTALALLACNAYLRALIRRAGGPAFASPTLLARAGLCHAFAAALLCVQMVLLGKGAVLVLAGGAAAALQPRFGLLLASWTGLCLFWVWTLNALLARHDALFIIPAIEVCWSVLSLTSGGIFFAEYAQLSQTRFCVFGLGIACNVAGVWRLTRRGEKSGKIG